MTGVHVALTAALCFTAETREREFHEAFQTVDKSTSEGSWHIRHSIWGVVVVIVDGAVFPGQHRVVIAPDAWCGELVQNILSLMEGHQTHTE